jgi:hypothetical protein
MCPSSYFMPRALPPRSLSLSISILICPCPFMYLSCNYIPSLRVDPFPLTTKSSSRDAPNSHTEKTLINESPKRCRLAHLVCAASKMPSFHVARISQPVTGPRSSSHTMYVHSAADIIRYGLWPYIINAQREFSTKVSLLLSWYCH